METQEQLAAKEQSRFEYVVIAVIVINAVVIGWGWLDHHHEQTLEVIHTAILVFFVGELVWRLHQAKWHAKAFFSKFWNVFDFTIIALALLPVLPWAPVLRLARLARLARLIHTVRHVRNLQFIRLVTR